MMAKVYSVWVGGTEVTDNYVSYNEALETHDRYERLGYDDIIIEEIEVSDLTDTDKNIAVYRALAVAVDMYDFDLDEVLLGEGYTKEDIVEIREWIGV